MPKIIAPYAHRVSSVAPFRFHSGVLDIPKDGVEAESSCQGRGWCCRIMGDYSVGWGASCRGSKQVDGRWQMKPPQLMMTRSYQDNVGFSYPCKELLTWM